jgi:hypothetical protein
MDKRYESIIDMFEPSDDHQLTYVGRRTMKGCRYDPGVIFDRIPFVCDVRCGILIERIEVAMLFMCMSLYHDVNEIVQNYLKHTGEVEFMSVLLLRIHFASSTSSPAAGVACMHKDGC